MNYMQNINNSNLNVLMLSIPTSWSSGVTNVFLQLVDGLRSRGISVGAITHGWTDSSHNPKFRFSIRKHGVLYYKYYNSMQELVSEEIIKSGFMPDIIHLHTHTFSETFHGGIQTLLKSTNNPPVVYTVHAIIPYSQLDGQRRRIFFETTQDGISSIKRQYPNRGQYEILNLASRIITISEMHTKVIEKLYPEFSGKYVTIRNASDMISFANDSRISAESKRLRMVITPKGEKIIMYVGRVEEVKAAPNLVRAFNTISQKYPTTKLVFIGTGPDKESVKKNIVRWGLKPNLLDKICLIDWVSGREQLAAYYKMIACSSSNSVNGVMIMPVRTRNLFGLAVLEAMSIRVPVITCENDEGLGFGTTPEPENLARIADYVLTHPIEVYQNVEHTLSIIKQKYSVEKYVNKNIQVYLSLIDKKKPLLAQAIREKIEAQSLHIEDDLDEIFSKAMKSEINGDSDMVFTMAMRANLNK